MFWIGAAVLDDLAGTEVVDALASGPFVLFGVVALALFGNDGGGRLAE